MTTIPSYPAAASGVHPHKPSSPSTTESRTIPLSAGKDVGLDAGVEIEKEEQASIEGTEQAEREAGPRDAGGTT